MSLVYNEDQLQLLDSARDFLAARSPVAAQRALRDEKSPLGYDPKVWEGMIELGWSAVALPEEHGGLNFGFAGFAPLFEQIGRHLTASPMLSSIVLCAGLIEQLGSADQKALLPALICGEKRFALALEECARHQPETCSLIARKTSEGYRLSGRKVWVADAQGADSWLVVARSEAGQRAIFIVPADTQGVSVSPRQMIDARNMAELTFEDALVEASALLACGNTENALERVLEQGRTCLAAELLGLSETLFEMTIDYLKTRVQFDAAIGSFQALQHRAARLYIELQLARSAVMGAFECLERTADNAAECARLSSLAKWKANQAAQLISNEAVQMHGGIGVTDEYDLGLYLKRIRLAQAQLGHSEFLARRYAEASQGNS
ncbi:acyl-CoA dehydrogenase family protein [Halopseudomonas phragmitis]|uniref:Acyl-CoA dehydrogenase n=1 Tax=Halopseudomonas phragmitis TaxID=1931241 RepID=A0A1V0B9A3_9GAMM|nr:acyl-CoA dehydrogenase family protein [Halopseudomonas phragmitis]AQZ96497.1 acyl-CoA dehydrogenase [Halopseudomonas phragmitis]